MARLDDEGNTIFMLMLRAGRASVFKLCKSNINAKPVINNLSASRERKRRRGAGRHRGKRGASRYEKEEPKRAGGTNCEQQGGTRRRWRLYYTCAFGPSGFAFENEMRKYRLLSPAFRSTEREATIQVGGTKGILEKRGRRSFDPSLTGPFLASFSLITRIPRPSAQIIVFDR